MKEFSLMKNNYQDVRMMWDKIGVSLSGLCLIHCLVLPLVAAVMPWLGGVIEDERIHLLFAAVTVPVALIAFIPGYLRHRRRSVLALGLVGAALLLLGSVGHDVVGHDWEHTVTVLGGMSLVAGHLLNFRLREICCNGELCANSSH
jgi:hypothetical protein